MAARRWDVMSAGSKRRAAESGLNGDIGGGRGGYKKSAPGNESHLNPEETLQQAVLRLDSVKACTILLSPRHLLLACAGTHETLADRTTVGLFLVPSVADLVLVSAHA